MSSSCQQLAGGLPPFISGAYAAREQETEARVSLAVTALRHMPASVQVPRGAQNFCFLMQMDLGRHMA